MEAFMVLRISGGGPHRKGVKRIGRGVICGKKAFIFG